jgi:hypothetical protein
LKFDMTGDKTGRQLSLATRRELIQAIAERYRTANRADKQKILDEFTEVTGFHRKHAIRALRKPAKQSEAKPARSRVYDEAVVQALTILWEAADRICGKRLKPAIPALLEAMERYGHLALAPEIRERVLKASAATIDRLLAPAREVGRQGRRRTTINTPLRKSIAVRTFSDWNDPPPGFLEMDMVAHCGKSVAGSHVHSLVLTDIASGWTEACALVVREQTLITVKVDEVRRRVPFPILGLDVDNDSAFINDTLVNFCKDRTIELTRSRAYKKNDQAWIEQKNGSVVRRLVGYGRLEGKEAAAVLDELHRQARLYVNFFLPCFKLKSKTREGAKVSKKYESPVTPYERLLANAQMTESQKAALRETFNSLDPVRLLSDIRAIQQHITTLEVANNNAQLDTSERSLDQFVSSLSTAWKAGEVRPTHKKRSSGPRSWRTRIDPFEKTWDLIEQWLNDQPDANAKELLHRLQQADSTIPDNQLRTLQRRVREWRTAIARSLIIAAFQPTPETKEEEVTL